MVIKFNLTEEDLVHYNIYYRKRHGTFFQKYYTWVLVFVVFFVFTINTSSLLKELWRLRQAGDWSTFFERFLIFFFPLVLILGVMFYFTRKNIAIKRSVKTLVKLNSHFVGAREISFLEDKVIMDTGVAKTEYQYDVFKSIETAEKYIYLCISSTNVVVLPLYALRQNPEAAKIIDILKRKIPNNSLT